jgi:hypothetical protein
MKKTIIALAALAAASSATFAGSSGKATHDFCDSATFINSYAQKKTLKIAHADCERGEQGRNGAQELKSNFTSFEAGFDAIRY